MAQYWLDFDRDDAEILAEWYLSYAVQEFVLVDDAGTRAIRAYIGEQYGGRSGSALWEVVPSASDIEIFAKMRHGHTSSTWPGGLAGRITGENQIDSYTDGYYAHSIETVDRTLQVVGTIRTELTNRVSLKAVSGVEWHYAYFGMVGSELSFRAADTIEDLLVQTPLVTTDTDFTTGRTGIYGRMRQANRDLYLAAFGVGTDGDPAPTGPMDVSAEPFALRHNPIRNKVIPVLSFPTVTDIGATCVRPRVTKGF